MFEVACGTALGELVTVAAAVAIEKLPWTHHVVVELLQPALRCSVSIMLVYLLWQVQRVRPLPVNEMYKKNEMPARYFDKTTENGVLCGYESTSSGGDLTDTSANSNSSFVSPIASALFRSYNSCRSVFITQMWSSGKNYMQGCNKTARS